MCHHVNFIPENDIFPNPSSLKLFSVLTASAEDIIYSGEEISISCPEIVHMNNVDFCNKMQEFCDFCGKNFFAYSWKINSREVIIEPFARERIATAARMSTNPQTTKIKISREGFVSIVISTLFMKRPRKRIFTANNAHQLLDTIKNSLIAFINGDKEKAICFLQGGAAAQQAENKRIKRIRIMTYIMFMLYLTMFIGIITIGYKFRDIINAEQYINREMALEFIQNNQNLDGSLGYRKKIRKSTSTYWQTAASLVTLSQLGETHRVDISAAAKYLASKQKVDGGGLQTCHCEDNKKGARVCRDPVASDPGSIAEMAFPVEALKSVGKLDAIDHSTLIKRIASSQDANGLFIPAKYEGVDKYKFTYLCLLMLADMDALDAVDVNVAWKALVEAKTKTYPPRYLEIYLFDLSQKLNIDDSEIRDWIITQYQNRLNPIFKKDFDDLREYDINTLQQATDVYLKYDLDRRTLRKIDFLLTPVATGRIYQTSEFFPQILAKEKIHAAFNSNFSDRAMMFSARYPVPIYVLALVIALLTIRFGQKESRRLRYIAPECQTFTVD